jgi:hypothetical protein
LLGLDGVIMKSAAQRIMELFSGSETISGTHGTPYLDDTGVKWAIKKVAKTLKIPVTLEVWEQHLSGKRPLGVIPIRADSLVRWGSIDIDDYDIDLMDVVKKVEVAKLPLVPCRSKSGGLHLFMFMTDWTPAEKVQGTLRDIAASLGFAGSEIFPKQTKILASQGEQGNWMIMPYFGSDYGGKLKFQYGLKKTGAEMTLDEFLTLAERKCVTEADLEELKVAKPRGGGKRAKGGNGAAPKVPFSNGPPCLQHMAEGGFPLDGRKRAIFMIGIFLKKAFPNDWQTRLDQDNQTYMRPPLPADEINSVIKSLEKKDYEYTCKEQPMASHCNSVVCRGRKFGVGTGGEYPVIEAMSKLDTDPPLWFVDIPGAHIAMTTEELTSYRKFHTLCVARAIPPVAFKLIRDEVWMGILNDALQKVERIEASSDTGVSAVFHEMLEEFLTNRTRGVRREDLLRGAPWENEEKGRHYFRLRDLQNFLNRQGSKMGRPEITTRLREDYQGETEQFKVKGNINIMAWWIKSSSITRAPTLDPPQDEEDLI